MTEAVFNKQINCLQEISVRTLIGKNSDILVHPSFPLELFHYVLTPTFLFMHVPSAENKRISPEAGSAF